MKAYLFVLELRHPLDLSTMGRPQYHVTYGVEQESTTRLQDFRPSLFMDSLGQLCSSLEQRVLGKDIIPKGKRRMKITGVVNAVDKNYAADKDAYCRPLNNDEIAQLSKKVRDSLARD